MLRGSRPLGARVRLARDCLDLAPTAGFRIGAAQIKRGVQSWRHTCLSRPVVMLVGACSASSSSAQPHRRPRIVVRADRGRESRGHIAGLRPAHRLGREHRRSQRSRQSVRWTQATRDPARHLTDPEDRQGLRGALRPLCPQDRPERKAQRGCGPPSRGAGAPGPQGEPGPPGPAGPAGQLDCQVSISKPPPRASTPTIKKSTSAVCPAGEVVLVVAAQLGSFGAARFCRVPSSSPASWTVVAYADERT